MGLTWLLMVLLLAASGLASGAETAVFSLRHAERRRLTADHPALGRMLEKPTSLLVSLLLANLLINVGFFTASSTISMRLAANDQPLMATFFAAGSLITLVIGGEILPKSLSLIAPFKVARLLAPLLMFLRVALGPIVTLTSGATRLLEGLLLGAPGREDVPDTNDFKSALSTGSVLGAYRAVELALLHDVVDLGVRKARTLMVPRVDVTFLSRDASRTEWIATMAAHPFTDYPVVGEGPDDVVGTVNGARVLLEPDVPREQLLQAPLFVPVGIAAERLVERMLTTGSRLAILLDEHGGVAGVIGITDLTSAVLGEVEGLSGRRALRRASGAVLLPGDTALHELVEELGLILPSRGSGTLSGGLAEALGRVPRRGDEVCASGWRLRVTSLRGRRVETVLARPGPRASSPGEERQP